MSTIWNMIVGDVHPIVWPSLPMALFIAVLFWFALPNIRRDFRKH